MSDIPRGIRNNNPGNIVKSETHWVGEKECDDSRFECFERPKWGIRAMARVLSSYYHRHNLHDVASILHRWMPPSENNTEMWIKYVVARCDNNYITLNDLIPILITIENGYNPYSKQEIEDALPSGNYYNVRFNCNISSPKDVGKEAKATAATPAVHAGDGKAKLRRQERSSKHERSRIPVDSKDYSSVSSWLNYSSSSHSSTDITHYGNIRMDTVRSGVPIYEWGTGYSLEDYEWNRNNSPRYPFGFFGYWDVLRREPY